MTIRHYQLAVARQLGGGVVVVAKSPRFRRLLERVACVARARGPVLLRGETGVGKTTLAMALHFMGERPTGRFVRMECGSQTEPTPTQTSIFGSSRLGEHDTLFMHEIGDLSRSQQARLVELLAASTASVQRPAELGLAARLVVSTSREIEKDIKLKAFRADLYYRLNAFSIRVPPLREHREDLGPLALHFLTMHAARCGKKFDCIDESVVKQLSSHAWPGNAWELDNVMRRAAWLTEGPTLRSLPAFSPGSEEARSPSVTLHDARQSAVLECESRYLTDLLLATRGKVAEAARVAGVTPRRIYGLAKKHSIKLHE